MKSIPPFTVVYQDDYIAVLNKRSGMLIAADRWDAEAPRLDLIAQEQLGKLYAVHRIDKDTSGLIIYARDPETHRALSEAFEKREVDKTYHALIYGRPSWTEKEVSHKLLPDGDLRHRTIVDRRKGKESLTHFRMLGICGPYSWIEAKPVTGRTHQIRAHLAAEGYSIVCDPLYGGNQKP
ncbi:MAG: RNA pseudouridine synthase, partial [Spirochaetaceae bacterium]|nr:RNA pseudouridine synthase [Spirochaetaceae bacterium]